jgi:ribosomal protein L3 glutamine methyltransferase
MTAIDISQDALDIAGKNIELHELTERIHLLRNDLLTNIEKKFDLILANLPYIPSPTLNTLDVRHYEPSLALDGGEDGLRLIRQLLEQAPAHLQSGGAVFLEIEATLETQVKQIAQAVFPQARIDLLTDYAELPRLVKIQQ